MHKQSVTIESINKCKKLVYFFIRHNFISKDNDDQMSLHIFNIIYNVLFYMVDLYGKNDNIFFKFLKYYFGNY